MLLLPFFSQEECYPQFVAISEHIVSKPNLVSSEVQALSNQQNGVILYLYNIMSMRTYTES